MQPTIYTFLIVCPLVFLAGFVDAVAGGGGLISLPAYLLAGVPIHNAVATNKLSSATGTLISTVRLCKNKFVDWILVLPCIPMALLGSTMGAHVALIASDKILRYMLIPVLPVVAFYVLRKKNMDEKGGEIARKKQILICALCSLAVGCYDGFYGPGTGTFLLLLYTGLGKMSVAKASGTMKVTNLSFQCSSPYRISAQRKDRDHAWNRSVCIFYCRTLYRCGNGHEKRKPDHPADYPYSPCTAFYKDHIRSIKNTRLDFAACQAETKSKRVFLFAE